ncbi:Ltp family lipoprotein [Exiguobacterium sp. 9-2]|uniref:Ltp family lipoprotein n=1 Tax=Exiguobacterium sp. 9-2 TaxID=3112419 RepID=UPI002E2EBBD9|nr:Ltp family lipoprotein [Exiguobacterium sp. 9-2]
MTESSDAEETEVALKEDDAVEEDTAEEDTVAVEDTSTEETGAEEPSTPDVPTEYLSALDKAGSYAETMNMSKAAVSNQLTSDYGEQFSKEAAAYAMENMSFDDWKSNALKSAESYSETMNMSKKGIYDQLTSDSGEKFTSEEAQYAIDTLDVDYNQNALQKAKEYQETMSMSPEAIRDQLSSDYGEKFTPEEANFAVSQLK